MFKITDRMMKYKNYMLVVLFSHFLFFKPLLAQDGHQITLPEEGLEIMTLDQWKELVVEAPGMGDDSVKNRFIKKLEANLALAICQDPSVKFCGDKACLSVASYEFLTPSEETGLILTSLVCSDDGAVDEASDDDCDVMANLDFTMAYLSDDLTRIIDLINNIHAEVQMSERGRDFMKKPLKETKAPEVVPQNNGYLGSVYNGLGFLTSSFYSMAPEVTKNIVQSSMESINNEMKSGNLNSTEGFSSDKVKEMMGKIGTDAASKTVTNKVATALFAEKTDNQDWDHFFGQIEEKYLGPKSRFNDDIKGKVNELFQHTKKEMDYFKRDFKSKYAESLFRSKKDKIRKDIESNKARIEEEDDLLSELQEEMEIRNQEREKDKVKEEIPVAEKPEEKGAKIQEKKDPVVKKETRFKTEDEQVIKNKIEEINEARRVRNSRIEKLKKQAEEEYQRNKEDLIADYDFNEIKRKAELENKKDHFSWSTVKTLNPVLYAKLLALKSLWKIPQDIKEPEEKGNIIEALDKTLFLGTKWFFENTKDLIIETRNNSRKALYPDTEEAKRIKMIKRVNLGGGPPGTGKSYMAVILKKLLNIPVLSIVGSEFRAEIDRMKLGENDDTFEIIKGLLETKILEASRELNANALNANGDPVRYKNILVLLDDWDSMFTDEGPLSAKRLGGVPRRKFFHLLKKIGDVSQNDYFGINLLKGEDVHPDIIQSVQDKLPIVMPIDSQYLTFYLTFNAIPDELDKNNDGPLKTGTNLDKEFIIALRSRVRDFMANSPTPEDRKRATDMIQDQIIQKIAGKLKIQVKDRMDFKKKTGIDFEYCEKKFDEIIAGDVWAQEVLEKNQKHLSIRPLVTMMTSYSGLIHDAIDLWAKGKIDKDLCKNIEFNVAEKMRGPNEYELATALNKSNQEGEKILTEGLALFERNFDAADISLSKKEFFHQEFQTLKNDKVLVNLKNNIDRLKILTEYLHQVQKKEAQIDKREVVYKNLKKKLEDYEITGPHFRSHDEALKQMERQMRFYLAKERDQALFDKKVIIVNSKREGPGDEFVKDLAEFYPSISLFHGAEWNKNLREKLTILTDFNSNNSEYNHPSHQPNNLGLYRYNNRLDGLKTNSPLTGKPNYPVAVLNLPEYPNDVNEATIERDYGIFFKPRHLKRFNSIKDQSPLPPHIEWLGDGTTPLKKVVENHLEKYDINSKSIAGLLLGDNEDERTGNDAIFGIELNKELLAAFKEYALEKEMISGSGEFDDKFLAKRLVEFLHDELNNEEMKHKNYHVFLINKLENEGDLDDVNAKNVVKVALGEIELKHRKVLLDKYVASKIIEFNALKKHSDNIFLEDREKELIGLVIDYDNQQGERALKRGKHVELSYAKKAIDIVLSYVEKRTKRVYDPNSAKIKFSNEKFMSDYIKTSYAKYYKSDSELEESRRKKRELREAEERKKKQQEAYEKMLLEIEAKKKEEEEKKLKEEEELKEKTVGELGVKRAKDGLTLEMEARQKEILQTGSGLGVNFTK